MEPDQPYSPPDIPSGGPHRTLASVVLFASVFLGALVGSILYSHSRGSGFVVMGGFLLPNGETTRIDDVGRAGLPPWIGYEVHKMSSSGQHYATVYSSIDYPRAVINILWCLLLAVVALLRFRRKPQRSTS